MEILLFGSTGMVGTAVETVCKDRQITCISIPHSDADITNPHDSKNVIEKYSPDVIINSAALVGVIQCELEPKKAFDINAIAVSHLAKICEKNKITFVQISSSSVFDGKKNDFYTEKDLPNPTGIYSVSKYVAECLTRNTCNKYYIIRLPLLFGKRKNRGERFLDKLVEKIQNGGELRVSVDIIDSPTYTNDAANTLITMLEEEKTFGLYHVANSGKVSLYEFVSKMVELSGADIKIVEAKDKDFKSPAYKPPALPLKSIKLKPIRSWQDALRDYVTKDLQILKDI